MGTQRAQAWAAPAAFAGLAAVLAGVGAVRPVEAFLVAAAVGVAFLPSGWVAPGGWRRRAAELALLPVAYAFSMLGDATLRQMALPPLVTLVTLAAVGAAVHRTAAMQRPWLIVSLAVAVRLAGGLGLLAAPPYAIVLAIAAPAALGWGGARWGGFSLGIGASLLTAASPLPDRPLIAATLIVFGVGIGLLPAVRWAERLGRAWLPGALAAALVMSCLAPWGGMMPSMAFPAAGWWSVVVIVVVMAAAPLVPAAAGGVLWLAAALAVGPLQPAPPDIAGLTLTAERPAARLAPAGAGPYIAEIALANAAGLEQGTVVAHARVGDTVFPLRAGAATSEWAHQRSDVLASVGHRLPDDPVWRPGAPGAGSLWSVAGRIVERLPAGATPVVERAPGLPERVAVSILTAGPSRPTPPRDWTLAVWLAACACVIALLQFAAGVWRSPSAWLPWALLAATTAAAALPVAPLRLLLERHAIDLALVALLAAWLPAARRWLLHGKVFAAAAALLVPLALATPHLTPPMYGDEPFHLIVLDSLAHDRDLNLANNYDLEHHPYNRIYVTGKIFLHSPTLAALLLPGYLVAGRAGALALLAMVGAGLVAVLHRRGSQLGIGRRRLALLCTMVLLTYPIATFATQIWVELVGALAAALGLLWLGTTPVGRVRAVVTTVLATAVKTRLALVTFPQTVVAWWPRRWSGRAAIRFGAAVAGAAGLGLLVGWAFLGHPLGYRRLRHLIPHDLTQPVISTGGLLFDAAGGLTFANPLALVALLALPLLWRRGGAGERALIAGGAATFAALLSSHEWYGGGAPPARYLVPLLPVAVLAGALLLQRPQSHRRWVLVLLPPAVLVWWVLLSRPHFSINPGDGGWWLSAAIARRFAAGARHLFPSFLVPRPATWIVPVAVAAAVVVALFAGRRWSTFPRRMAALTAPLWLLSGATTILGVTLRHDTIVEVEEPQVVRRGGAPEPPPGTFSRFLHVNGWRLGDGDAVEVPLNLSAGVRVVLTGAITGMGAVPVALDIAWDAAPPASFEVTADVHGDLALPPPPGAGRHVLRLGLRAPAGGAAVLDRVVVER